MEVFVVFGDVAPFPGLPGNPVDRKILYVVDSQEKARALIHELSMKRYYKYIDFEVFTLE